MMGSTKANAAPLICDKFEIVTSINGSTLEVSLETDLPDDTKIMITVDRSYWERGNTLEYARPYWEQKSSVGEWRKTQKIDISPAGWNQNLKDFQAEMAKATLGFEVARISDNIEVRIVAPLLGQTNSAFGDRNRNLQGKAVTIESHGHYVRGESQLNYPL